MKKLKFKLMMAATCFGVVAGDAVAQERERRERSAEQTGDRTAVQRADNQDTTNARKVFVEKVKDLVKAGKLSRAEAGELISTAFPDAGRAGGESRGREGAPARGGLERRTDYGYSGKNKISNPEEHAKAQGKPIFSGPQRGERISSFKAVGLRGDLEGKEFDPISRAGDKPHLLVFTKGATGGRIVPLLGYQLETIMKASEKDWHFSVVHLSDKPSEITKYMGLLKGRIPNFVDVGLSKDGQIGPGSYGLDRTMTHTFIFVKDGKVAHNLVFSQQVFFNEPHILGAIADVMGADHATLGKWLDSGTRQLPGERRGGGDRGSKSREGRPSRADIIRRFDKDGDGELSEEEGRAARKALGR